MYDYCNMIGLKIGAMPDSFDMFGMIMNFGVKVILIVGIIITLD